jgi:hypothetical protein
MSAVKLWKAQQQLSSQWSSLDYSKWPIVGIGENAELDYRARRQTNISSTTLNRISACSPAAIHRALGAKIYGPMRLANDVNI